VTFIEASGLCEIGRAYAALSTAGCLKLIHPSPQVCRVFDVTGMSVRIPA